MIESSSKLSKVVQVGREMAPSRLPSHRLLVSKVAPDKGLEAKDQGKKAEKLQE